MKILLYVLLAFGVFCFFSCKRTEKEQLTFLMKEWTRKEILFHDRAVFTIQGKDTLDKFPVSIRPRACFFPLFSFLPLWLHYNLNPLCVQY